METKNEAPEEVKEYQCSGCVCGCGDNCYKKCDESLSCEKHVAGTMISGIGTVYLGMPSGFNRIGECKSMILNIYKTYKEKENFWAYDKFNIPVWKNRNDVGHVLIRGLSPRINVPFIHIVLECSKEEFDKINCLEITEKDKEDMD